jgi:hypothetical protein
MFLRRHSSQRYRPMMRKPQFGIIKLAWFFIVLCICQNAFAQRHALIIANQNYQHAPNLNNPIADAQLIAESLRAAGFLSEQITLLTDLSDAKFERAASEFGRRSHGAEIALIYYAGHGQEREGKNFLLPVDANPIDIYALEQESVTVQRLLDVTRGAHNRILILDACREDPFPNIQSDDGVQRNAKRGGLRRITIGRGLEDAKNQPQGTLIAFSTTENAIADDGPKGGNSPFALALAKWLKVPGLEIAQIFTRVRDEMAAKDGSQQMPWMDWSIGTLSLGSAISISEPILEYTDKFAANQFMKYPAVGVRLVHHRSFEKLNIGESNTPFLRETSVELKDISESGHYIAIRGKEEQVWLYDTQVSTFVASFTPSRDASRVEFIDNNLIFAAQLMDGAGGLWSVSKKSHIPGYLSLLIYGLNKQNFYFTTSGAGYYCTLFVGKRSSFPEPANSIEVSNSKDCVIGDVLQAGETIFVGYGGLQDKELKYKKISYPDLRETANIVGEVLAYDVVNNLTAIYLDGFLNLSEIARNSPTKKSARMPKPREVNFSSDGQFLSILTKTRVEIRSTNQGLPTVAQLEWPGSELCGAFFTASSRGLKVYCKGRFAVVDLGTGKTVHALDQGRKVKSSQTFAGNLFAILSEFDDEYSLEVFELMN